jgi:hypothetical protein
VHTNAKVWSNWISNLESKANVNTLGQILVPGFVLAVVNKNSQLKRQSQNSQILPATQ